MTANVLLNVGINPSQFRQDLQGLLGELGTLGQRVREALGPGETLNQFHALQDQLSGIVGADLTAFENAFDADEITAFSQALGTMLTALERNGVEGVDKVRASIGGLRSDISQLGANGFTPIERGGRAAVSHIQSAFTSFVRTGEIDFQNLARSIAASLANIAFDEYIREPLEQIFEDLMKSLVGGLSGGGKGGGLFSQLFQGLGSVFSGLFSFLGFGGGKALGGSVSAGRPYVVGEQGRELFVPETSGRIVPNGIGGGASIVFNVQTQDADSFRRSESQIAAMLHRMASRGQRNL